MIKKLFLIGLFFVASFNVFAQKTVQNQHELFSYAGQFKINTKWGFLLEAQFRLDNKGQQIIQNAYRTGIVYFLSPEKNITLGYSLVNAYNASLDDYYKENRLWEQFLYCKKWHENRNSIIHRFRLEQRWVEKIASISGNIVSEGNDYQNRLRYQNRNLIHLSNLNLEHAELYAVLQDEIFVTLGNNAINSNIFDQNRFVLGFGLNCNNSRFEVGYMNQYVNYSNKNDVMNHTVCFSIIQNLDLHK